MSSIDISMLVDKLNGSCNGLKAQSKKRKEKISITTRQNKEIMEKKCLGTLENMIYNLSHSKPMVNVDLLLLVTNKFNLIIVLPMVILSNNGWSEGK